MFAVVESFEKECSLVFLMLALVFENYYNASSIIFWRWIRISSTTSKLGSFSVTILCRSRFPGTLLNLSVTSCEFVESWIHFILVSIYMYNVCINLTAKYRQQKSLLGKICKISDLTHVFWLLKQYKYEEMQVRKIKLA